MNFIRRAAKALRNALRVASAVVFRIREASGTVGIAEAPNAVIAPEIPEQNPIPTHVGPVPVPASDEHQLSPEVQAERDRFISQLLNPQQGAEAPEQALAAGSSITQAVNMLRRCFPKLVVRDNTTMAEVQRDAGVQSVIDALERLHQRGKV